MLPSIFHEDVCCTSVVEYAGGRFNILPLASAVPFIIRSNKCSRDDCKLIGECYVHGIIDGEAVGERSDAVDIQML